MGVLQNWDSAEGKIRWQWEHYINEEHPSDHLIKGLKPLGPQPYPAMLYRVVNRNPLRFESMQVGSENEQRNMESRGFVAGGAAVAVEEYDKGLQSVSVSAAERSFHEQRMSPKAQAEAEAVDLTTLSHLGEIPETPIKKRGRPAKPKPPQE